MADHLDDAATSGAVINRLLKARGGHVLVIGGKLDTIPQSIRAHPQVLLWDTSANTWANREVPTNTRAILYNQWIGHALARRVIETGRDLGCVIFPMLKLSDIRDVLYHAFKEEQPVIAATTAQAVLDHAKKATDAELAAETPPPAPAPEPMMTTTTTLREARLGEIPAFLTLHLRGGAEEGAEADRLLPLLHGVGIAQTRTGLAANIKNYRAFLARDPWPENGPGGVVTRAIRAARAGTFRFDAAPAATAKPTAPKPTAEPKPKAAEPKPVANGPSSLEGLDFDAVEQLFRNAIKSLRDVLPAIEKAREVLPALELVQEELPKVKREIRRLQKIREAMQ